MEPLQLPMGREEPIEGEYRVLEEEEERPRRRFPWQKARRFGAAAGKGLGRGIAGTGRAAGGFAGGFATGLGTTIPRVSAESAGRATGAGARLAGRGIIGGAKFASRVRLREPSHFWGPDYLSAQPQRPYFYGHVERMRSAERRPTSRLDTQTQMTIVEILKESYPELYERLWYQGITVSEMVGTLRGAHPDVYEQLRSYSTMTSGYPSGAGFITL